MAQGSFANPVDELVKIEDEAFVAHGFAENEGSDGCVEVVVVGTVVVGVTELSS